VTVVISNANNIEPTLISILDRRKEKAIETSGSSHTPDAGIYRKAWIRRPDTGDGSSCKRL
jgi:hypothetical protein